MVGLKLCSDGAENHNKSLIICMYKIKISLARYYL